MEKWRSYNTSAIIKNITQVFKNKDMTLLTKPTYDFLYHLSGFIAHYNVNGFIDYYNDLRVFVNDFKASSDLNDAERYIKDRFVSNCGQKEYYESKYKTLLEIKSLIPQFENDINSVFSNKERAQDITTIKALMSKHNLQSV